MLFWKDIVKNGDSISCTKSVRSQIFRVRSSRGFTIPIQVHEKGQGIRYRHQKYYFTDSEYCHQPNIQLTQFTLSLSASGSCVFKSQETGPASYELDLLQW